MSRFEYRTENIDIARVVNSWQKKYGKVTKPKPTQFDPSKVSLKCAKCKLVRPPPLHRHHKGCDFTFAYIAENLLNATSLAKRYIEFREEDCDKLCDNCHRSFHNWIAPFRNVLLYEVQLRQERGLKISMEWLRERKKEMVLLYEAWKK